jgi:hypothetical protein
MSDSYRLHADQIKPAMIIINRGALDGPITRRYRVLRVSPSQEGFWFELRNEDTGKQMQMLAGFSDSYEMLAQSGAQEQAWLAAERQRGQQR